MGKSFKLGLSAVAIVVFTTTCIEQINPEAIRFDDLLVVEALITDQPVHQEVFLSKTQRINRTTSSTVFGATVWIIDQDGQRVDFVSEDGSRYASVNPYGAQVGGTVQLFINLEDGRNYESEIVTVQETSPADSIYAEFTPVPIQSNLFGGRFDFFVDSRDNSSNNRYFRWKWNTTYEFSVRTPSRWLFIDNEFIIRERGSENDSLQVEICWKTFESNELAILELLVPESGVEKLPIYSFHSETGFMKRGFMLEIMQYGLSQESYNYWQQIETISQEQGSLSDTQPGTIVGNIRSTTNPSEIVLGIFDAAQEQVVRRRFRREEFFDDGFRVIRSDLIECFGVDSVTSLKTPQAVGQTLAELGEDWVLTYFTDSPPFAYFFPRECAECTENGTNVRPAFWE